jgi:divalent metal cation (Fe/Co/Zn/Cd) transporter
MGGLFSIYEGWHKLHAPEPLNQAWIALIVLGVSIVLETGSLIGCVREINKLRGARSFKYWFKHTRNAELVVVLGEDIAALLGLVIAFVFVALAMVTGDTRFDALGSVSIGVVLICISVFIAIRIKRLIVGTSAEEDLRDGINEMIREDPAIEKLFNAITLQVGPKVMLAAKIRMRPDLDVGTAVEHINALERRIGERFPEIGWCFIEPDVED